MLETIEQETAPNVKASVIWLHGLGASGDDFAEVIPMLELPPSLALRFIFPHAPIIPVSVNNGYSMRAWYDIKGIGKQYSDDIGGIKASSMAIAELVSRENSRGIKSANIVLAGFSQGGAMCLYTGLRYSQKLAGLLALSAYLPACDLLSKERSAVNSELPIMLMHGTEDIVVPPEFSQYSYQQLECCGYQTESKEYRMPHSVCEQQLVDIGVWLAYIFRNA